FAPLSVKSGGDFADILSQDNPDVWRSHRPAESGDAAALYDRIIARAIELREARTSKPAARTSKPATRTSKPSAAAAARRTPAKRPAAKQPAATAKRKTTRRTCRPGP